MTTPDINLDISTPIPGAGQSGGAGYVIGRTKTGTGPAHLISIDSLAQTTAQRGSGAASSGLGPSGVTSGSYTSADITVNAAGIITAASDGSGGGGGSGLYNQVLSATPTASSTGLSTWLNQGSATVADGTTGIVITDTSHAGLSIRMRTKAAPSTPYTITACVAFSTAGASNAWAGIGWYNGSDKLELIGMNFSGSWLFLAGTMNTTTSYNANDAATGGSYAPGVFWVQIKDDGTNITMGYGIDGANFLTLYTVAKSSGWLGATGYSNVGFFMASSSNDSIATLMSYKET
jgi:hypothetical protein